jgi:hypothetical protein
MTSIPSFLKIDPIVAELLRAGFGTYKKHYKAYIILNISFTALFFLILGFPNIDNSNTDIMLSLFKFFESLESFTQTILFYSFIGLIVTIFTYYFTFRETLRSGELGLEIQTPWTTLNQFGIIIGYNLIVLIYLLIWVGFFRALFLILSFNYQGILGMFNTSYSYLFLALIFLILLIIAFFLFVVKMTYFIYMLDEFKVPTQALDPIILIFGILFGIMILFLDIINFFIPNLIIKNISIIITYLTPGTLIMPIIGYSMAHLKVASTILGFEPLMLNDEPAYT